MTAVATWLRLARDGLVDFAKWLWSHPVALAGAVGAIVGAVLMVRSKKNQVATLKDALEVQRIQATVARDEAQAELLTEQADVHAEEVKALQSQIAASKRRAAELAHGTDLRGKSDAEIAKLFTDAGF